MTLQDRKVLATELRQAGLTYKEIAEQTGYSLDWCKRNLNTVDKNKTEKTAIREAIKIAKSEDGITSWQIDKLVRDTYPQQEETDKEYSAMLEKARKRFKSAINKEQGTIIRPYWMAPQQGVASLQLLMASVDSVQQSMDDAVHYMRQSLNYNESYTKSIRFAIIKLLLDSGMVPEGVETHCDRLADIAYKLDNPGTRTTHPPTLSHTVEDYTQKCAPKSTSAEKCDSVELHQADELDIDLINSLIADAYEPY